MIVTCGGEKGGVGKTTLAVHLAYLLAREGKSVLLVDADPQMSASAFIAAREAAKLQPRIMCIQKTSRAVAATLQDLANHFENVVVDTGGRDTVELRGAMLVSHQLVVPINPTAYAWWTLEKLDNLLGEVRLQNPALRTRVLLNQVSSNPTLTGPVIAEAQEKIGGANYEHLELMRSVLISRAIYGQNEESGRTCFEPRVRDSKTDTKAGNEMRAVQAEIYGHEQISFALGTAA
jgi:chromosome partitioning protein